MIHLYDAMTQDPEVGLSCDTKRVRDTISKKPALTATPRVFVPANEENDEDGTVRTSSLSLDDHDFTTSPPQ